EERAHGGPWVEAAHALEAARARCQTSESAARRPDPERAAVVGEERTDGVGGEGGRGGDVMGEAPGAGVVAGQPARLGADPHPAGHGHVGREGEGVEVRQPAARRAVARWGGAAEGGGTHAVVAVEPPLCAGPEEPRRIAGDGQYAVACMASLTLDVREGKGPWARVGERCCNEEGEEEAGEAHRGRRRGRTTAPPDAGRKLPAGGGSVSGR